MDIQSYAGQPASTSAALEYAVARVDLFRNYAMNVIEPLGDVHDIMPALPLSVMQDYYDQRAISPVVRQSYFDRMAAAEAPDTRETGAESEKAESEEGALTGYLPSFEEGRGYDVEAVEKMYDRVEQWYSDPKTAYRDYQAPSLDVNG